MTRQSAIAATLTERAIALWVRGPRLAVLLLTLIVILGTLGYHFVEGWPMWDSFYMTVTTVATVGYREVHPLSFRGQAFTIVLILCGVGTAFYTVTLLVAVVVEGGLQQRVARRRFNRMLDELTNHFILCGFGRIGGVVATELQKQGIPFVIVERNDERMHSALERGWIALAADASQENVLKRAGIDRARGLIAAVGTDAENVYTVLTARVMRPDLFIIARVESDDAEHKLRRAGADRVISPYHIGATHIAQTALRPAIVDFIELVRSPEYLDLSMEQVHVKSDSKLADRSLADSEIRQKFGVIIIGIKRHGGQMEFNPGPDAVIHAGDELLVLGPLQRMKALEETVGK